MQKMKSTLIAALMLLSIITVMMHSIKADYDPIEPPSTDLIGYWNFDEGSGNIASDYSGHENHGIITGATWVNGISGSALYFDGDNDWVAITNADDFQFVNQGVTFSAWVQIFDNANTYRNIIVLGDEVDGLPHMSLSKARSGYWEGNIYAELYGGPGSFNYWARSYFTSDTLPINDWIFVTAVLDYENALIKLYVNGVLQESRNLGGYDLSQAQSLKLRIGATPWYEPWWGYCSFHGIIDEVHIYNKSLSVNEIAYLYSYPGSGNQPPVATNDAGTVLEDSTNNQIDVTVNDYDVNNDNFTIISTTQPLYGTVISDVSYCYYTPIPLWYGNDTFTYTISDGNGGTATATVFIWVVHVNHPPIAEAGGPYNGIEGTPIVFDASESTNPEVGLVFEDNFDDNEKDALKWIEWSSTGSWWEQNQRTEFQLYETTHNSYEGIESSTFSVFLSPSNAVTISADMLTDIAHYSGQYVGAPYLEVTDGTNRIQAFYSRNFNELRYADSNDGAGSYTVLKSGQNDGTWGNDIQIYSDRYKVKMNDADSGWVYNSLFASNATLKVRLFIKLAGDYPYMWWRAGFDNVKVSGQGLLQYRWDFDNDGIWDTSSSSNPTANFTWGDDFTGIVRVEVNNGIYSAVDSANVTILNVPPTATLENDGPKDEGSPVTFSFTNQYDPGTSDTFTYSFDWDNDGTYDVVDQAASSAIYTWYNTGAYTITGRIKDNDGGFNEYTTTVTIYNVPPIIISINGTTYPIEINVPASLIGMFADPGWSETFTATIDWGDGNSTAGNITGSNGNYTVTGTKVYALAGVFTVTLTVQDNNNGSDSKEYKYLVVYNPDGGFVTGNGWFDSPAGAYPSDPNLTGKARFGFVSRYLPGHSTPDGHTKFQFKVANLDFYSNDYEWLVISGKKATYRGNGTINDQGNYGFKTIAIDGDLQGGDGNDRYRIIIWDKNNQNTIIYDNLIGHGEDVDPIINVGGNIIIHRT